MTLPIYVAERNAEAKWAKVLCSLNISDSFDGVDKHGKISVGKDSKKLISILGGSWPHFIEKQNIDLVSQGLTAVEDLADRFMGYMGKKTASMLKDDVCKFVADKIWYAKYQAEAFSDGAYQHICNGCFALRLKRELMMEGGGRQCKLIGEEVASRIEADKEIITAIRDGAIEIALGLIKGILEDVVKEHHQALINAFDQAPIAGQLEGAK